MSIFDESLLLNLNPLSDFWEKMEEFKNGEKNQRELLLETPWGEEQDIKEVEYSIWVQEKSFELLELFEKEVKELEEKQEYYFGCSFKIYKMHYEKRKKNFFNEYEDTTELDFIEEELQKGIFNLPYEDYQKFIFTRIEKQFNFSLKKRFQFLTERAIDLGFEIIYIPQQEELNGDLSKETYRIKPIKQTTTKNNITPLQNSFTPTQILELTRAIIETGNIEGNKKDIIKAFAEFFQVEINNPDQLWQTIKARKQEGETIFLDHLKKTLIDSFKK